MKKARIVESVRGAHGGYRLRRPAGKVYVSEVIRLIDGPLAPFGDAESLRAMVGHKDSHSALYGVFLDVRNAVARILESTTIADICGPAFPARQTRQTGAKRDPAGNRRPGRGVARPIF